MSNKRGVFFEVERKMFANIIETICITLLPIGAPKYLEISLDL